MTRYRKSLQDMVNVPYVWAKQQMVHSLHSSISSPIVTALIHTLCRPPGPLVRPSSRLSSEIKRRLPRVNEMSNGPLQGCIVVRCRHDLSFRPSASNVSRKCGQILGGADTVSSIRSSNYLRTRLLILMLSSAFFIADSSRSRMFLPRHDPPYRRTAESAS